MNHRRRLAGVVASAVLAATPATSHGAGLAQIPSPRDPDTPTGEMPSAKVAAQRPFIYRQVKLGFDEVTIVEAATGTTAGDLALALSLLDPSAPVRFFDTDGETLFIEF